MWVRGISGDIFNALNGSVVYEAALSANASTNITVTSKPRYIMVSNCSNSSHPSYQAIIYDVEEGKGYQLVRSSSAYAHGETPIDNTGTITSVTSSTVTLKNTTSGARSFSVLVWY